MRRRHNTNNHLVSLYMNCNRILFVIQTLNRCITERGFCVLYSRVTVLSPLFANYNYRKLQDSPLFLLFKVSLLFFPLIFLLILRLHFYYHKINNSDDWTESLAHCIPAKHCPPAPFQLQSAVARSFWAYFLEDLPLHWSPSFSMACTCKTSLPI